MLTKRYGRARSNWVWCLCLVLVSSTIFADVGSVCELVFDVLDEGGRRDFAKVTKKEDGVLVESADGRYWVYPDKNESNGLPEIKRDTEGKAHAKVGVDPDSGDAEGKVRSMFRGDSDLHPHQRPKSGQDGWKSQLSKPQKQAVDTLVGFLPEEPAKKGSWVGLVMPPGVGKTTTSAKLVEETAKKYAGKKGWKKKPKVLFVVENTLILDSAVSTYSRELGLSHVAQVYGKHEGSFGSDTEMIAITRSGYHERRTAIHKLLDEDPDQPWIIVFDEAHHLGTGNGQFRAIVDDQDKVIDHRHVRVKMSATLWHPDEELHTRLGGNVWGPFLTKSELAQLQRGENLPELARLQLMRAMSQGYLTALDGIHMVTDIKGNRPSVLFHPDREFEQSVADDISNRLKETRVENVADRGAIFVTNTKQADRYAAELSQQLGSEVRALHGKRSADENADTLMWIQNKGKYDTDEERRKHKYIIVVSMLDEGTDIPNLNLVIAAKSYSDSASGFRGLVQNLGRGTRAGTDSLRFIDYSGFSHVLADGVESMSVSRSEEGSGRSRRPGVPNLTLNGKPLFTSDFRKLDWKTKSFDEQYPDYDESKFMHRDKGAFAVLEKQSSELGVGPFSNDHGLKKVIEALLDKIEDFDGKREVLARLSDLGMTPYDGGEARKGIKAPQQRAYTAIRLLAEAYMKVHGSDGVDVSKLHLKVEFEKLVSKILGEETKKELGEPERLEFEDKTKGALAYFEEVNNKLDIGGFNTQSNPEKTLVALAKLGELGDLTVQALHNFGLQPNVGKMAKRGTKKAQQQLYGAIYLLAKAYNDKHPGDPVELTKIHLRSELARLAKKIISELAHECTPGRLKEFVDEKTGAFSHLESIYGDLGIKRFKSDDGLAKTLVALANRLRESPERASLLSALALLKFNDQGGAHIGRNPTEADRAYRAIRLIAATYNKLYPKESVDLERIYLAEELKKMTDVLFGESRRVELSDEGLKQLMDKSHGSLTYILGIGKEFGVTSFSNNDGFERVIRGLIDKLGEFEGRDQVLMELGQVGLKKGDVAKSKENSKFAQQRIANTLRVLARAFNRKYPDSTVNPELIHQLSELKKVTDKLRDEDRPFEPDENSLSGFTQAESGSYYLLKSIGVDKFELSFGREHGAEKTARELIERLGDFEGKDGLLLKLERLEMRANDGSEVKSEVVRKRVYLATRLVGEAYNLKNEDNPIDLAKIHESSEFKKIATGILGESAFISLGKQEMSKFVSEQEGAFHHLAEVSGQVGVTRFGAQLGVKRTLLGIIDKLGDEQIESHARRLIEENNFKSQDSAKSKLTSETSMSRIYRGLHILGLAYNQRYPERKVDASKLYLAEELQKITQHLLD